MTLQDIYLLGLQERLCSTSRLSPAPSAVPVSIMQGHHSTTTPHTHTHLEATQPARSQARQTAAHAATCLEECVTPLGKGPARNTQTR